MALLVLFMLVVAGSFAVSMMPVRSSAATRSIVSYSAATDSSSMPMRPPAEEPSSRPARVIAIWDADADAAVDPSAETLVGVPYRRAA